MDNFMNASVAKTRKHIARVDYLLQIFVGELNYRGLNHDKSKYEPIEAEALAEMERLVATEGNIPFASPEYEERKKILQPMLEHHYANNSHHPEHYPEGVNGMNLFDIVEMFCDWKAASERGEEPSMNLKWACDKYQVSDQLRCIFYNTAKELGWKAE